ncbi:hypothetical protein C0992_000307, partial [Termitomyces sp. T32_za158]
SYTKFVTLVTTAITSFGLLTITAWLVYEQYIAPFFLPDAPWRPLGKRVHEWKSSMSEKSRHLILSGQRFRGNSSSDSIGSESTSSQDSFRDPEDRIAPLPTSNEAQSRARMRLKRGVRLLSNLKAASRPFTGRSRKTATVMADATPISPIPMVDDKIKLKSPLLLTVPDKPLSTISLPAGTIQDMEYSPNGRYLATTG